MCWFHVVKNVKKPDIRKLIPPEYFDSVLNDLRYLHMSLAGEYLRRKQTILAKWSTYSMPEFIDYFTKQWLEGRFCKWQIYHTPAGFASTDNPVESFNARLKGSFTDRSQMTIFGFIQVVLDKVVPFYSMNHREFFFIVTQTKLQMITRKLCLSLLLNKY